MDEEFFFPQNVTTTYRILGMGPRHLRRGGVGLAGALGLAVLVARQSDLFTGLMVSTLLLLVYVAGFAYPTFGEESLADVWLHLWAKSRVQTRFPYVEKEVFSGDRSDRGAGG